MIEIFRNPNYNFIGMRRWAYAVSIVFTLIGLVSLGTRGIRYDIDFTGGTLVQVRFDQAPPVGKIRAALAKIQLGESIIQEFGESREYIIRLPLTTGSSQEVAKRIQDALAADPSLGKPEIRRVEFVGQMNDAVNQTLSRTVLTSLTVFFSTAILLFLGGKTLEDFAFVLFVGVITGTYSTTYVAAALVVDWTLHIEGRRRGKKAMARA